MDLALREDVDPREGVARKGRRRQVRVIFVGGVGNRKVGKRVHADVLEAKFLLFRPGAVVIDRERAFR